MVRVRIKHKEFGGTQTLEIIFHFASKGKDCNMSINKAELYLKRPMFPDIFPYLLYLLHKTASNIYNDAVLE